MCFPIKELSHLLSIKKIAPDKMIQQLKFGKEDARRHSTESEKKKYLKNSTSYNYLGECAISPEKTDELQAMVKFEHDYRNVCLMALKETCLSEGDFDPGLRLDCFGVPVCMDWDARETGKVQGDACLCIRKNWCKSVSVKGRVCMEDIE